MHHLTARRLGTAAVIAAALALGSMAVAGPGEIPPVAVVFGHHSYMESPQGEGASALTYMNTVREALDTVGVPYAVVNDLTVETGGLGCYDIAIFPYNFVVPEAEEAAIEAYVRGGGKIVVFYSISQRVADLVGLRVGEHTVGRFQTLRLRADRIQGLPAEVTQGSWNIRRIHVGDADAEILGEWLGPGGEPLGEPGLAISPRGAYLGHVLTEGDYERKGRMLLAVLGEIVPPVWSDAVGNALGDSATAIDEVERKAMDRGEDGARERARLGINAGRAELDEARHLAAAGQYQEAIAAALAARETAASAYISSAAEREYEMRGVWVHDAYGVPGWGWERSIRVLQEHGFNAVIANMLWAGLAHYPSDYLPVDDRAAAEGDQIAECLRWCREYGVELHVWKVNYNLMNAPPEFVERLRAESRLQRRADGSEVLWLCPSDPRNFALERDSMLEVVRKYDVAGIHFDYIRYPDDRTCYCHGCRERFSRETGMHVEQWPEDVATGPLAARYLQWRRDQITRLVGTVAEEARRIRPGVMVSAAVFQWPGAIEWVNQEWPRWVDEGLLDFVCPMNYTTNRDDLERMVVEEVKLVAGRAPLYIGIGEFIIPHTYDLVEQLELARGLGADGFVCFCHEHLGPAEGRLKQVHSALTAGPTAPPHPAPRVAYEFVGGAGGRLGLTHSAGSELCFTVALSAESNYAESVSGAVGSVWLETSAGEPLRRVGTVRLGETTSLAIGLSVPPGVYRLALRGAVDLASSGSRPFIVRSRPFEVLQQGAAAGASR